MAKKTKDPYAVALGRKGGKKGGKARWEGVPPEEHRAISSRGGKARWDSQIFDSRLVFKDSTTPKLTIWSVLRRYADKGATVTELADYMIREGFAKADRKTVVTRLTALLKEMHTWPGDRRVARTPKGRYTAVLLRESSSRDG
jgi:hypothetical protein